MKRLCVASAMALVLIGCSGAVSDTVSSRSEMWLDRLEIDLSQPESPSGRTYLIEACDQADEWHNFRANRESDAGNNEEANTYLSDWVIIGDICNQALFDDDWSGAAARLTAVRP